MKLNHILLLRLCLLFLGTLAVTNWSSAQPILAQGGPYPSSAIIKSISWDFDNRVQLAPGSDLWPVTWASDNNLYTSWGDGGGFGGTNNDGRVSLGFARMQGSPPNFTPTNIWGGKNPQNPAQFGGKAVSMLSLNGVLYAWLNQENGDDSDFNLAWSTNLGATWQQADWTFKKSEFGENTFLNFGRDYAGARDNYVYIYGKQGLDFATKIHLARVPKDQLTNRDAYEFFTGLTANNTPTWTKSFSNRQAVFEDSNGVGITSVVYNAGLKRYLLTTAHGAFPDGVRRLGVFDATEPWGPWTTVEYNENWGNLSGFWLLYSIPTKTPDWMSSDGKTIHVIFSSGNDLDSFNMVKGTLTLNSVPTPDPIITPTSQPTNTPTATPTTKPTDEPAPEPTDEPTATPTDEPTFTPTATATDEPTATPTATATDEPTATPTDEPTATPTATATDEPTATPTDEPTATPTDEPTATPTDEPTATPTDEPTATPTATATDEPTATATDEPTATPTDEPTATPTAPATDEPTATPTDEPTATPTDEPTSTPTLEPTATSTDEPIPTPTTQPSSTPDPIFDAVQLVINGPTSANTNQTFEMSVDANDIVSDELYGVQLVIDYDPALISIENLKVNNELTFILRSNIDDQTGKITVVASRQGTVPGLTGDVKLLTFDATAKKAGAATFTFEESKLSNPQATALDVETKDLTISIDGAPTPEPTPTGTPEPTPAPTDEPTPEPEPTDPPTPQPTPNPQAATVEGQVILAGRTANNWAGAVVTIGQGQSTTTDETGLFTLANVTETTSGVITADAEGYLSATCTEASITAPQTTLDPITLISGDITGDDIIDVSDATAVGVSFEQTGQGLAADINQDEVVDIFDLVLVSVNFGASGPTTWNCQ